VSSSPCRQRTADYITAHHETGGNTDEVTLNEANKYATEAAATTVRTSPAPLPPTCRLQQGHRRGRYTAGKAPQIGQCWPSARGEPPDVHRDRSEDAGSTCTVYLDRPGKSREQRRSGVPALRRAELAFHRDALALVTRPLACQTADGRHAPCPAQRIGMRVLMQ